MRADAIQVLIENHREINRACSQFEDLPAADEFSRRQAVEEIKRRLSRHTATELHFLHPLIAAAIPGGLDLIAADLAEHREAAQLLRRINHLKSGRDEAVHELIDLLRAHMESEERELFPLLRSTIAADQLQNLGGMITSARSAEEGAERGG